MKTNKISLIALLLATMILFCSCGYIFGDVAEDGDVTVVIEGADGEYQVYYTNLEDVENKSEGAKGIIEHLSRRSENPLALEMVDSTYGAYVSAIGNISENPSEGIYVIVYTSLLSDSYEGAPSVDYQGTVLYQAGLGLSGMTVDKGSIILFRAEKSPY
jgi:hypothetical protein